MPRATNQYQFEWMILEWAWGVSVALTGDVHYPFIIVFGSEGVAQQVRLGTAPEEHEEAEWRALRDAAAAWLCYDPFEGPEYTYVDWDGLTQETMQRLIGRTFAEEDLSAGGTAIAFPTKWGVMF